MKYIRILLTVLIGPLYVYLNKTNLKIQKKYLALKHEDIILFIAWAPFYWLFVALVFIISVPYEFFIAKDLH